MNQIDLAGKRAVVTGGAQGIGRAIAERFLASKASVALWDRDAALLETTARELAKQGQTLALGIDVSSEAQVARAMATTMDGFGGVDILVANAGITGPNHAVWEYPLDAWREVMDINLTGTFLCCRAVVPVMIAQNYGRIVNIASIAGKEATRTRRRTARPSPVSLRSRSRSARSSQAMTSPSTASPRRRRKRRSSIR